MQTYRSHRQKKYSKQALVYGVLLVVVVIFLTTIGSKLLITGTLFITSIFNPETPEKGVEGLMGPLQMAIPTATNSASLKITGKADSKKNLTLFVNDDIQKKLFLNQDNFEAELTLLPGDNTIYAQIQDPNTKRLVRSETYTVRYSNTKPKLEISAPLSPAKVYKEEIQVEGQTDTDITVYIQGSPVVVDAGGKFSESVRLKEGENNIEVVAKDTSGNSETRQLVVTYEKD